MIKNIKMRRSLRKNTFMICCLAAIFVLLFICNLFLTAKGDNYFMLDAVFCIFEIFFCIGEECPVGSHKQHKTLCNQYYDCVKTGNVKKWVLKHCDEGLVYNPSFQLCVLPGK